MLRCALTGKIPRHPVLSPQGIIFEKEDIQQYLVNSSFCPVTGNPLTFESLIDIQINPPNNYPSAVRATTFTDYLNGLTQEWNLAQKELYETRKQLAQCQRELAQALYENEAAKRVIARLISEGSATVIQQNINDQDSTEFDLQNFILESSLDYLNKLNFSSKMDVTTRQSTMILNAYRQYSPKIVTDINQILTAITVNSISKLLIGTNEGNVVVFDVTQMKPIEQLKVGDKPILSIKNLQDNSFLVSDTEKTQIYIDYNNSIPKFTIESNGKEIINSFWHYKQNHVLIVYKNSYSLYTIQGKEERNQVLNQSYEFSACDLHCGGRFLITTIKDAPIALLWDLGSDSSEPIKQLEFDETVTDAKFSPNGMSFIITTENHFYSYNTDSIETSFTGDLSAVHFDRGAHSVAWHENGLIFSLISKNVISIHMIKDLQNHAFEYHDFELEHESFVSCFGGGGSFFAAIGPENILTIINK